MVISFVAGGFGIFSKSVEKWIYFKQRKDRDDPNHSIVKIG